MLPKELIEAYNDKKLILFVGAGVSSTIGLPDWKVLIDQIAFKLGYDPKVLKAYSNDYLAIAEFYKLKVGSIGSLRSWMDVEWHNDRIKKTMETSKIHEYIAKGEFPIIYTTNYDRWLEKSHEFHKVEINKVSNVEDIAQYKSEERQVIKFHGDFDDDNSIVLDESSYYRRLDFETPLDIKFRGDVLGRSVLFLGYSLSDPNVRLLFYKLAKTWESYAGKRGVKPKSFVLSSHSNPVQQEILQQWGIEFISPLKDDLKTNMQYFLKLLVENRKKDDLK